MLPHHRRWFSAQDAQPTDLLKLAIDDRLVTEDVVRKALLPYATWTIFDLIAHPRTSRRLRNMVSVLGFVDANCYDPPIPDEHRDVLGISPGDAGMRRAAAHWIFTRRAIWCVGDNGSGRHRLYLIQSDQPGARVGDNRLLPSAVRVFDFDLMESP